MLILPNFITSYYSKLLVLLNSEYYEYINDFFQNIYLFEWVWKNTQILKFRQVVVLNFCPFQYFVQLYGLLKMYKFYLKRITITCSNFDYYAFLQKLIAPTVLRCWISLQPHMEIDNKCARSSSFLMLYKNVIIWSSIHASRNFVLNFCIENLNSYTDWLLTNHSNNRKLTTYIKLIYSSAQRLGNIHQKTPP